MSTPTVCRSTLVQRCSSLVELLYVSNSLQLLSYAIGVSLDVPCSFSIEFFLLKLQVASLVESLLGFCEFLVGPQEDRNGTLVFPRFAETSRTHKFGVMFWLVILDV